MASIKEMCIRLLSLRTLVAAMAIFLAVSASPLAGLHWLDARIFRLGAKLTSKPSTQGDVAVIALSDTEVTRLLQDPGHASHTTDLVRDLRKRGASHLAVVLDTLPRLGSSQAERLLKRVSVLGDALDGDEHRSELARQVKRFQRTRNRVLSWFQDDRVMVGIKEQAVSGASPSIVAGSSYLATSQAIARIDSLQPKFYDRVLSSVHPAIAALPRSRLHTGNGVMAWPSEAGSRQLGRTLLWQVGDKIFPDIVLGLYMRHNRLRQARWVDNQYLNLGSEQLPLGSDGRYLALFSAASGVAAPLERYSLSQVPTAPLQHKVVLLGRQGDPLLTELGGALFSLRQRAYYTTPWWHHWLHKLVLLIVAVYLMLIVPRLSSSAGILASALLAMLTLVIQLGWQITQWQWLPSGVIIQYLLIGHVTMWWWQRQHHRLYRLRVVAHEVSLQLGDTLLRQGRLEDTLAALKHCLPTEAVLTLLYDVGAQQERKRQYEAAVATYQTILTQQRGFKDVAERVQQLTALHGGGNALSNGSSEATTLVVSNGNLNKPVIGRYEIDRELGRGAMGIVYLGHDPKISRRVAIKTLNYARFEDEQLAGFKERFFREAEAAGRLNHPNIVMVYDAGEEHDLAFIAMDYVEGKTLQAFTKTESLLPIETVYRLVAEIAEALAYAHQQNIVHRDIKPGNLIYNPDREQVKVTDFGIARITDDSKTKTGDILGSPLYMAPEQLKGHQVSAAVDIYSLGVTFYQLLTGALPYTGDSLANLTYAIIHDKYKNVRDVRPELPTSASRIVNRALQKEPRKRFGDALKMANALRRSLDRDFE